MKLAAAGALLVALVAAGDRARGETPPPARSAPAARGLVLKRPAVSPGYVLFSPLLSSVTYLIDNDGRVVHTWKALTSPGGEQVLLDDGSLLRLGRDLDFLHFRTGGVGGWLERLAWDGSELWAWRFASERAVLHHALEPLPNGNVLALAWEVKTPGEAARAGRRADRIPPRGLWPDFVIEVEPEPPRGGRIVWEWHVWDHLVQDSDATRDDYGDPRDHPGRLDVNAGAPDPVVSDEELAQLQALGYAPQDAEAGELASDFLHVNGLDYNAALDQILLSVPELGELWILDHGTTRAEAATGRGGRRGRGGEILYRWGNPSSYRRGGAADAVLGYPHDARWIPRGHPGAGRILVFNNRAGGSRADFSSVEEIAPPLLGSGLYARAGGAPYGPRAPVWRYVARPRESLFAEFISGAQRTRQGNTLICSGPQGRLLEVNAAGEIVWEYWNPYAGAVRLRDGTPPQPGAEPFAVFHATRIAPDHPALRGRALAPLVPQPQVAPPRAE